MSKYFIVIFSLLRSLEASNNTFPNQCNVHISDIVLGLLNFVPYPSGFICDWYPYTYNGNTYNTSLDGGNNMYDDGNRVFVYKNGSKIISAVYNQTYSCSDYEFTTIAGHPFLGLLFVRNHEKIKNNFTIQVTGNISTNGSETITRFDKNFTANDIQVQYHVFQISGAGNPSICEVYFTFSNPRSWNSTNPQAFRVIRFSNDTDYLDNSVEMVGSPSNVLMGYMLLSRRNGTMIPQPEVHVYLQSISLILQVISTSTDFNILISSTDSNVSTSSTDCDASTSSTTFSTTLSTTFSTSTSSTNVGTSISSTTLSIQTQQVLQNVENFLIASKVESVSKDDVEQLSQNFNSLIISVNNLPSDSQVVEETKNTTKVFTSVLRRAVFPPNSSNIIKIKTPTFTAQVALVETQKPFVYEPTDNQLEGGVLIPSSILKLFASQESSNNSVVVTIIHYVNDSLFPSDENVSNIFSIDIGRNDSLNRIKLPVPLQITFPNLTQDPLTRLELTCVYWSYDIVGWLTDGCRLGQRNPPVCECDHTTNFALIVNSDLPPDFALTVISIIGFALSILGLSLTLILHIILKDLRKRRPSMILIHICSNLCISYIIFLAGVEHAYWNESLCIATAFFLHLFFLAAWGWMTVYSYDLYLSIVKIFEDKKSFFLRKFGGIVYGMSFVISVLTLSIGLSINKQTYLSSDVCWMAQNTAIISFFFPIGLMLCFNFFAFISVFRAIFGKSEKINSSAKKQTVMQQLTVAVTIVCFTGLAWIFAFFLLASNFFDSTEYQTVFSWLFVVFNTSQGFGIFLLTVVKRKETRKMWWNPIQSRLLVVTSAFSFSSSEKESVREEETSKQTTELNLSQTHQDSDIKT